MIMKKREKSKNNKKIIEKTFCSSSTTHIFYFIGFANNKIIKRCVLFFTIYVKIKETGENCLDIFLKEKKYAHNRKKKEEVIIY